MIEEVKTLTKQLGINEQEAQEIINIYFECYCNCWVYDDYLRDEIRIIKKTDKNKKFIEKLIMKSDMINISISDDYAIITNYSTIINSNDDIEDYFPQNSFDLHI